MPAKSPRRLYCLREREQFFEYDNQERIVKVYISEGTASDDVAAQIGNLHDLRELTFWRTDLTNQGFAILRHLVNLKTLSISGSPVWRGGTRTTCPAD